MALPKLLFIDVETYSSVDLKECGAYKYVESPDFEVLLIGYAFDRDPVRQIDLASGEGMHFDFLTALLSPDVLKVAHNAVFERLCFRAMGYEVPAAQWYCTAVKAAYCGLPLSLEGVSKVLDLEEKKLATGKMLIKYFSCSCKPTVINGMRCRNLPAHAPEKWAMYREYNDFDVRSEREIYYRLEKYGIPSAERRAYVLDQNINDRGVMIDKDFVEACIHVNDRYVKDLERRMVDLTGVENPNSGAQVKAWLESRTGEEIGSLSKEAMPDLVARFAGDGRVSEVLDLRKRLSRTSVEKYYTALDCAMDDDRVRGLFQFYGANRTGRWAGRLLQLQNLPKNHIADIAEARSIVKSRDLEAAEMLYDDVSDILSQLVRTALVAPEGKVFAVADFSAIEARVISWLADEQWRLDVFHGDGKIYEATGSKMFGVPVSAITKGSELRGKSKISELALGYEGSVGALKRMGGERMGLSENEMRGLVDRWRLANPKIVALWRELDRVSKEAVKYRTRIECTPKKIAIDGTDRDFMTVTLPSGRKLLYYHPVLSQKEGRRTESLYYEGTIQATRQWGRIDTYGGKLTENIVQAIARDLLLHSMQTLEACGFPVTFHVHDECIVEVPAEGAEERLHTMEELMGRAPSWAEGLPLRADGYLTPFYMKD